MNELSFEESCALKLIRLVASPHKEYHAVHFAKCTDAFGHRYENLFNSLEQKGYIRRDDKRITIND